MKNKHIDELHSALVSNTAIDYYGQRRLLIEHDVTHGVGITMHTFVTDHDDEIVILDAS